MRLGLRHLIYGESDKSNSSTKYLKSVPNLASCSVELSPDLRTDKTTFHELGTSDCEPFWTHLTGQWEKFGKRDLPKPIFQVGYRWPAQSAALLEEEHVSFAWVWYGLTLANTKSSIFYHNTQL